MMISKAQLIEVIELLLSILREVTLTEEQIKELEKAKSLIA